MIFQSMLLHYLPPQCLWSIPFKKEIIRNEVKKFCSALPNIEFKDRNQLENFKKRTRWSITKYITMMPNVHSKVTRVCKLCTNCDIRRVNLWLQASISSNSHPFFTWIIWSMCQEQPDTLKKISIACYLYLNNYEWQDVEMISYSWHYSSHSFLRIQNSEFWNYLSTDCLFKKKVILSY